jgi:hypothetical protein
MSRPFLPARLPVRDDSAQTENSKGRVDGEQDHAEAQDDEKCPFHGRSQSAEATPEPSQGRHHPLIPWGAPRVCAHSPPDSPHRPSGVGPTVLHARIPYGHDPIEDSVSDVGTLVVFRQRARAGTPRALVRTADAPPDGSRSDVIPPLDGLGVLLNGELHAPTPSESRYSAPRCGLLPRVGRPEHRQTLPRGLRTAVLEESAGSGACSRRSGGESGDGTRRSGVPRDG